MRIVDLFCGVGGVAEATRELGSASIVCAVDIDRLSNHVYQLNHDVTPTCRTLESIEALPEGEVIWMSPPCQPYTRRGAQRGADDPRSAALAHLIDLLRQFPPERLILENVPEFQGSPHHRELTEVLERQAFQVCHHVLCPTQWGVPMRRKRFYLRASRRKEGLAEIGFPNTDDFRFSLREIVDESAWRDPTLQVSKSLLDRYAAAMDVVDVEDRSAVASCFTSAYGESPVRAGSYLHCHQREKTRRFSVREITALMGYREEFQWPAECTLRQQYRMLGNALSVQVTRTLLESVR